MAKQKMEDKIFGALVEVRFKNVADIAYKIFEVIKNDQLENQLLSLGALLVCMIHHYGMTLEDILGFSEGMIYSDEFNNMDSEFKSITKQFKKEWEI